MCSSWRDLIAFGLLFAILVIRPHEILVEQNARRALASADKGHVLQRVQVWGGAQRAKGGSVGDVRPSERNSGSGDTTADVRPLGFAATHEPVRAPASWS